MTERTNEANLARFLNSTHVDRLAGLSVRIVDQGIIVKERPGTYTLAFEKSSFLNLRELADIVRDRPRAHATLQLFYQAEVLTFVTGAVFTFQGKPLVGGEYPQRISMKAGETLDFEKHILIKDHIK